LERVFKRSDAFSAPPGLAPYNLVHKRNQDIPINYCYPIPLAFDLILLAASQLSCTKQLVPQDDPEHPANISIRANRKNEVFWLQQ
jgi:hypothetical protein